MALDIQIVDGAALLLHGLLDRSTEDNDAKYASAPVVEEVARQMATEYGLPVGWLNLKAAASPPDDARWVVGKERTSTAIRLADLRTLAAMKLAAERQKDIEDLGRIAYEKYGEDSVPLSASRENYEIVAEEAIAAAAALRRHR